MQPILGLVDHHRIGTVENFVIDFDVPPYRQAVHDDSLAPASRAKPRGSEAPVAQSGALLGLLFRLSVELYRAPRFDVHRVGADQGVVWVIDDVHELAPGLLRDLA